MKTIEKAVVIFTIVLGTFVIAFVLGEYTADKRHFKEIKSYINKDGMQIINIKAFGANGRDKKDDSKAIYEALYEVERFSNCESIKGSIIYFPRGIYIIKNTINVDPGKHGVIISGVKFDFSDDSIDDFIFENLYPYEAKDSIGDKTGITSGIRKR